MRGETICLTGVQFHHWMVVRDLRSDGSGQTGSVWCRCVPCGVERWVLVRSLARGHARGCRSCVRRLPAGNPATERALNVRAGRRGDGLCPRCGSTPVEGAATCRRCLDKERDRYRTKRGTVKVWRCRFCNEPGHNATTCTAAPAAAEGAGA